MTSSKGDMQLTRQEVTDSQLLVTTPEKYDVVTRKGGDGSLGTLVNLIIIDEVSFSVSVLTYMYIYRTGIYSYEFMSVFQCL